MDLDSISTEILIEELNKRMFPNPAPNDKTIQEVYDSMTQEQQRVLHFMVGVALERKPGE